MLISSLVSPVSHLSLVFPQSGQRKGKLEDAGDLQRLTSNYRCVCAYTVCMCVICTYVCVGCCVLVYGCTCHSVVHHGHCCYRDIMGWLNSMSALVSSDELAKDVANAEALLAAHQVTASYDVIFHHTITHVTCLITYSHRSTKQR